MLFFPKTVIFLFFFWYLLILIMNRRQKISRCGLKKMEEGCCLYGNKLPYYMKSWLHLKIAKFKFTKISVAKFKLFHHLVRFKDRGRLLSICTQATLSYEIFATLKFSTKLSVAKFKL